MGVKAVRLNETAKGQLRVATLSQSNVTIPAGGYKLVQFDFALDGYEFLGVVGWFVSAYGQNIGLTYIRQSITVWRNFSSSELTDIVYLTALYVKKD